MTPSRMLFSYISWRRPLSGVGTQIEAAEETFKDGAGPNFGRQRRSGCLPRKRVAVGAAIAVVAVATLDTFFAAKLQRSEARGAGQLRGSHLIDGDAGEQILARALAGVSGS